MELCQLGWERLDHLATGVNEVATSKAVEDLEDPYRTRRRTGTLLWIERDLLQAACRHGPPDLELDQCVDEERDEVARHEPLDAGRIVEEHEGDELVTFQLVVSALEAGLVLVGGEDVSRVGVLLVGDERPAAIGASIGPDDVLTDLEVDPVFGASDLAVAGVCAGAPGLRGWASRRETAGSSSPLVPGGTGTGRHLLLHSASAHMRADS